MYACVKENSKVALASHNGWHQHLWSQVSPISLGVSKDKQISLNQASFSLMPLHWGTEHVRFLCAFKEQQLCFLWPSGFLGPLRQNFWGFIFQDHDSQAGQPNCPFILVLLIIRKKICININFTCYLHSSPKSLHFTSEVKVFINS